MYVAGWPQGRGSMQTTILLSPNIIITGWIQGVVTWPGEASSGQGSSLP